MWNVAIVRFMCKPIKTKKQQQVKRRNKQKKKEKNYEEKTFTPYIRCNKDK